MGLIKLRIFVGGTPSTKNPGKSYAEVSHLHNAEMMVNSEMTWLEAFEINFGINLNPDSYIVRRVQRGLTKLFLNINRELTEKIQTWLTEDFTLQSPKEYCRVELLKRKNCRNVTASLNRRLSPAKKFSRPAEIENGSSSSPPKKRERKSRSSDVLLLFKSAGVILDKDPHPSIQLAQLHEESVRIENVKKKWKMTWLEFFKEHFGIDLDPDQYFVRRYLSRNLASIKQHDLREPVKHLIEEFPVLYQNKGNTVLIADYGGLYAHSTKEAFTPATTSSSTLRAKRPRKRKLNIAPPNESGSDSSHDDFLDGDNDEEDDMLPHPQLNEMAKDRKTNGVSAQGNSHEPHYAMPKRDSSVNGMSSKSDNQDVQSEDIRQEVYSLASRLTNSQLLKAKAEILKLKQASQRTGSRDLWSDWNTTCPLPAAILRDLFDV